MRDITDLMNNYRECSRNLWNVYFSRLEVGCSLDSYETIRKLLFSSLVEDELSYEGTAEPPNLPPPALRVVPKGRSELLIKTSTAPGEASVWGVPRDLFVRPNEITLAFIDYWDFGNLGIRDFHYYLCKILNFPGHPENEGREALVRAEDGYVFHDEEHDDDPPNAPEE